MERKLDEALLKDLRHVLAEAEQVLRETAESAGAGAGAARQRLEEALASARESLGHAEAETMARVRRGADLSERYVRDHPWHAVGIASAVGLVLGLLIGRR